MLFFINTGGETSFLLEGKDGLARLATIDYKACDTGIKVGRTGFVGHARLAGSLEGIEEQGWFTRVGVCMCACCLDPLS